MAYRILFSATARKNLHHVPPRIVPAIIECIYGPLARNPHRVGKPLKRELAGFHSARRGPYRIVYVIEDRQVTVELLRIDHRADFTALRQATGAIQTIVGAKSNRRHKEKACPRK